MSDKSAVSPEFQMFLAIIQDWMRYQKPGPPLMVGMLRLAKDMAKHELGLPDNVEITLHPTKDRRFIVKVVETPHPMKRKSRIPSEVKERKSIINQILKDAGIKRW